MNVTSEFKLLISEIKTETKTKTSSLETITSQIRKPMSFHVKTLAVLETRFQIPGVIRSQVQAAALLKSSR